MLRVFESIAIMANMNNALTNMHCTCHLLFDGVDNYVDLNKMDVSGGAITYEASIRSSNFSNCASADCRIISKATNYLEVDLRIPGKCACFHRTIDNFCRIYTKSTLTNFVKNKHEFSY